MARLDLKATVLTLAMLLPTTWSLVWLTLRPERPVNSALVSAMNQFLASRRDEGRRARIAWRGRIHCPAKLVLTASSGVSAPRRQTEQLRCRTADGSADA